MISAYIPAIYASLLLAASLSLKMEGRSFSELYRNTSEDLFIKTMTESTIGMMPAPTMEMLGFKNLTQNFRTDSEELFKSWLTNGENTVCHSTGIPHRPRQLSRRISAELASLTNRTVGVVQNKTNDDIIFQLPSSMAPDSSNDLNSNSAFPNNRTGVEKELQASNMFLAKAWFQTSLPMTRSRSSELRRRYVAMQNSQTQIGMEALHAPYGNGLNNFKQESPNTNGLNNIPTQENPNHFNSFMSPSNSSSSNFNNTHVESVDKISSVVSMLKGTLERKKLSCQGQVLNVYENQDIYQDLTNMGVGENQVLQEIEESLLEVQTLSVCESSMNQMEDGRSPEDCYRSKDLRERIYDNSKEEQKKGALIRYGSVTSAGSVDRGNPTKKRRVERSRKMAEAKERSSIPVIPSDMQSILKRCENLEKEVRSLKLNLAFMNRKDSEQTKQIEELQKQNEELAEEKERLFEEIERIIP